MRNVLLTVLVLAMLPVTSPAQVPKDNWENLKQLQAGHKIKVQDMSLKFWDGRLVSVSDEAITIREKRKQQEITVERAKVFRVTDLERSRRGRNALIGLIIGTAVGAALAADEEDLTGLGKVVVAMGVFGGPGAAVGALIPSYPTIYRAQHGPAKATAESSGSRSRGTRAGG